MSWLKAGQIAFMAYEAVKGYVHKSTEQEISSLVVNLVRLRLDSLVQEINRRTGLYAVLSLLSLGVIILGQFYPQQPVIYATALVVLLSVSLFLFAQTLAMVNRWINYLQHIDSLIDESLRSNMKKLADESLYKKALVWISERSQEDYRDKVIVEIVRSISAWLRQNKSVLLVRLLFMLVFMLLFVELLQVILHSVIRG